MLIQIHILQNYAPANLNRDDTGAPKDATFGGYRRGRISSQCLKRSIRRSAIFEEVFAAQELLGVRTKSLPARLKDELEALGATKAEVDAILPRLAEIGRESAKGKGEEEEAKPATEDAGEAVAGQTKQLIFLGLDELRPMAEKLLAIYRKMGDKWKKAKIGDITKELGSSVPRSVDIAMFGRMTTSEAFEDVQAAVQVAHAISTHALTEEFDYYTAVDDLSGQTGAGMIGDIEFNSSTYYKYFNVHWEGLVKNLGGDREVARRAVLALIEAAAVAQPSGKQNSFAAFNLPDLVAVEVSARNLPVSYANAFLKPVRPNSDATLMEASIDSLSTAVQKMSDVYGLQAQRAFLTTTDRKLHAALQCSSLAKLKEWVADQLPAEG